MCYFEVVLTLTSQLYSGKPPLIIIKIKLNKPTKHSVVGEGAGAEKRRKNRGWM